MDDLEKFTAWLKGNGAVISAKLEISKELKEGRGVVAIDDIAAGELLFSIPKKVMIMVDNSRLASLLGDNIWTGLGTGWMPLIVTMIWENAREDSFWRPYFDILPETFSSPMFWSSEELKELIGCDIEARIGKEAAEAEFSSKVQPMVAKYKIILGSPELYTLTQCHRMGSLIMAYSFNLSGAPREVQASDGKGQADADESDDESQVDENGRDIAMIPFADLLNSKTGHCNAKLYNGPAGSCVMRAERKIVKGEQIFNTYGPLPNGELVRRYGYYDSPNQNDSVALQIALVLEQFPESEARQAKLGWIEEQDGIDDEFVLPPEPESSSCFPVELLWVINVLNQTSTKSKHLKKVVDELEPATASILSKILQARLSLYATTLEQDENLLQDQSSCTRRRMACVIRAGEKRILHRALDELARADFQDDSRPIAKKARR